MGDLGDPDVPDRLVAAAVDEFGGLDAMVANAGIANPGALKDLSLEDWDGMFSVNVRGAWLLAKASYPHLRDSVGAACFTSSMSGQLPHAGSGAYSPSKAALTLLAQTLALEWAPDGIRVNVVSPGMTRTGMTEKIYIDPEIEKARTKIIPLARIGDPMDIANVIEFLVSPLSGYVTGQDICVDGGFSKSILSHIPGRAWLKILTPDVYRWSGEVFVIVAGRGCSRLLAWLDDDWLPTSVPQVAALLVEMVE